MTTPPSLASQSQFDSLLSYARSLEANARGELAVAQRTASEAADLLAAANERLTELAAVASGLSALGEPPSTLVSDSTTLATSQAADATAAVAAATAPLAAATARHTAALEILNAATALRKIEPRNPAVDPLPPPSREFLALRERVYGALGRRG